MIIDIVLIILVVIALIYGIYKGFAGVLLGFIGSIIIAVALGVGLFFLSPSIMYKDTSEGITTVTDENGSFADGYTDMFMLLYKPISNAIVDTEDSLLGGELVMVDDELQIKVANENGEGYTTMKFSVAVKQSVPFFGSKSSGAEDENTESDAIPMLDNFITKYGCESLTVGHAVSAIVTLVVWCVILWNVLYIILIIIKAIIRRFVFRALDKHSVASKIDRAIGAVISVVVIVCVAWLAVSLAGTFVGTFGVEESFQAQMNSNPICGFFAKNPMFGGSTSEPSDVTNELLHQVGNIFVRDKIY